MATAPLASANASSAGATIAEQNHLPPDALAQHGTPSRHAPASNLGSSGQTPEAEAAAIQQQIHKARQAINQSAQSMARLHCKRSLGTAHAASPSLPHPSSDPPTNHAAHYPMHLQPASPYGHASAMWPPSPYGFSAAHHGVPSRPPGYGMYPSFPSPYGQVPYAYLAAPHPGMPWF